MLYQRFSSSGDNSGNRAIVTDFSPECFVGIITLRFPAWPRRLTCLRESTDSRSQDR
jgi:hypothetical protein